MFLQSNNKRIYSSLSFAMTVYKGGRHIRDENVKPKCWSEWGAKFAFELHLYKLFSGTVFCHFKSSCNIFLTFISNIFLYNKCTLYKLFDKQKGSLAVFCFVYAIVKWLLFSTKKNLLTFETVLLGGLKSGNVYCMLLH